MGAYLKILSPDDLAGVHATSLRILEEVGILVDHAEARERLGAAGARVDHDTKRVYFPRELVEGKLAGLPRAVTYHGRSPDYDITISARSPIYSRVAGGATGYVDLQSGQHRPALLNDWREFATLVDALPNVHVLAQLYCADAPEQSADVYSLRLLLDAQRKGVVHNALSLRNLQTTIEMLLVVAGSREQLRQRPPMHLMASPISPLFFNEDDTDQILLACEYGIPLDLPIMPTSGTTAPITLAGTLALANAEYLGIMTLVQCVRPGHPMPYFTDPVVADMRTAAPLFAAPEVGLLVAAIAQLGGEYYGLPTEGIGLDSDGFTCEQALFQKAQNSLMQCLAGGRLVVGAGAVEACMALSPVQLVIDDEIVRIARRWASGIRVNEETLAFEALKRVGPRGHFLTDEHTLTFLRSGELITTELFERGRREAWEMGGARSVEQKARDKALAILQQHEVPPLPQPVRKELDTIVRAAQ